MLYFAQHFLFLFHLLSIKDQPGPKPEGGARSLIFLLLLGSAAAARALLHVLPLDASRTATAEGRLEREVDVLLRVQTDDERRNVHDLLADTVVK